MSWYLNVFNSSWKTASYTTILSARLNYFITTIIRHNAYGKSNLAQYYFSDTVVCCVRRYEYML
jgi:hypothetical protein